VAPLRQLIGKEKFIWDDMIEEIFQILKQSYISNPIFVHTNLLKPFYLETNAPNFVLKSKFLEYGKMGSSIPLHFSLKNSEQ